MVNALFTIVENDIFELLEQKIIDTYDFTIYTFFKKHHYWHTAKPSQNYISKKTGISRSKVNKSIKKLKKINILNVEYRHGKTSIYKTEERISDGSDVPQKQEPYSKNTQYNNKNIDKEKRQDIEDFIKAYESILKENQINFILQDKDEKCLNKLKNKIKNFREYIKLIPYLFYDDYLYNLKKKDYSMLYFFAKVSNYSSVYNDDYEYFNIFKEKYSKDNPLYYDKNPIDAVNGKLFGCDYTQIDRITKMLQNDGYTFIKNEKEKN